MSLVSYKKNTPSMVVSQEKHSAKMLLRTESLASNTLRAYMSDLSMFCYWLCGETVLKDQENRVIQKDQNEISDIILGSNLSDATICKYLEDVGFQHKINTIKRKLASLSWALGQLGITDLTKSISVKDSFKGLRKLHAQYAANLVSAEEIANKGVTPPALDSDFYTKKSAPALRINTLLRVMAHIDDQANKIPKARLLRDKALLSLWWAGAFRRSEIASLQWSFITFEPEGLKITLPFSKTDQAGKGITKGIAYASKYPELCAVSHLKNWLGFQSTNIGRYVFCRISHKGTLVSGEIDNHLTTVAIVNIMRGHLQRAGIPKSELYTGHSPRRGFVSDAYHAGAPTRSIQKQGGWRSEAMLNTYIEEESVFDRNATKSVF
ncbi:site-specific integrase [Thiomicrospira sp.]|uniref:site-specific integrase n=1 Tax=Thiomicrospira sp. TaxID=935 RepID=UPI002F920D39